MKLTAVGDR